MEVFLNGDRGSGIVATNSFSLGKQRTDHIFRLQAAMDNRRIGVVQLAK